VAAPQMYPCCSGNRQIQEEITFLSSCSSYPSVYPSLSTRGRRSGLRHHSIGHQIWTRCLLSFLFRSWCWRTRQVIGRLKSR